MHNVLTLARRGAPYSQSEWLFGVIEALAYAWGGRTGVFASLLPALLLQALMLVLIVRRARTIGGLLLAAIASLTMSIAMSPRPQIYSFLFFSFGAWAVWAARENWAQGRPTFLWPVWGLAVLTLLWGQMHESALLSSGLILGALVFARSGSERKAYLPPLVLALVLAFAHPGAFDASGSFLAGVLNPRVLNTISEWASPNFHGYPGVLVLPWAVILAPLAVHWGIERKDWMAVAWAVAGATAMLFAQRFAPYAVIGVTIVLAAYWPVRTGAAAGAGAPLTVVTLAGTLTLLLTMLLAPGGAFPNREPMGAIRYLEAHRARSVFTYYDYGDALDLYGPPPWLDGRTEIFAPAAWWPQFTTVSMGEGSLAAFIARYDPGARYVLWPLGTPGAASLETSRRWQVVDKARESLGDLPAEAGVFEAKEPAQPAGEALR